MTRVISRMKLQEIFARAVGDDDILNDKNVVDFVDDGSKVCLTFTIMFCRFVACLLDFHNL